MIDFYIIPAYQCNSFWHITLNPYLMVWLLLCFQHFSFVHSTRWCWERESHWLIWRQWYVQSVMWHFSNKHAFIGPVKQKSFAKNCDYFLIHWFKHVFWVLKRTISQTGPRSAVGNVSGYRCVSDCRSRGREFDPGPVPYFRGDWSWNNFYGHSPPFRWFIQEGLVSVTSESMCMNYWLTACSSLPRKKCG